MDEEAGFVLGVLTGGFAGGLEGLQLGRVLFDRPADPLFTGCEKLEVFCPFDPGAAQGQSSFDFGVGVTVGVGMLLKAEGENGIFKSAGAVETPVVLGDGLGEVRFEGANGGELFADGVTVFSEGGLVFRSMDDNLAGEAVAEGVERGSLFAFLVRGPVESCALAPLTILSARFPLF